MHTSYKIKEPNISMIISFELKQCCQSYLNQKIYFMLNKSNYGYRNSYKNKPRHNLKSLIKNL